MFRSMKYSVYLVPLMMLLLVACDGEVKTEYPVDPEQRRADQRGKLTGDGLILMGRDDDNGAGGASPIGVNSFLWRATLDTVSFMPLASADPFGGVIITDWYEDPAAPGERYKLNTLILDRSLRADTLKVTVFRQRRNEAGEWQDMQANPDTARRIEDTILTRARELRVKQSVQ